MERVIVNFQAFSEPNENERRETEKSKNSSRYHHAITYEPIRCV